MVESASRAPTQPPQSPEPPKRDRSIDVLKGIGIVLVAMGHIDYSAVGESFISYLYTFNVALFFVIAGYTWKPRPGVTVGGFVWMKFRQIYVPYMVLFVISLAYGHLVVRRIYDEYVIPFEWGATAKALVFSSEWLNSVPTFNFALWFLPIFFIATLAFQVLQLLRERTVLYLVVVGALLAVSLPLQYVLPGRPVLSLNVLPVGLVLMAGGYLLRRWVPGLRLRAWSGLLLLAFTLAVAFFIPGNISAIRSYLYFPAAIASFVLYLALARQFESNRFLGFVGRNSLLFFGIQGLVAHTYTHTRIPDALSAQWDGVMLYLANLSYVMVVSAIVIVAYRWASARLRGLLGGRSDSVGGSATATTR